MTRTTINKITLIASLASFAGTALFAQLNGSTASREGVASSSDPDALDAGAAPYVIFSNLDRSRDNRYNETESGFSITGKNAPGEPELSYALAFVPTVDVQAEVLIAAIGYVSGAKLVNLGIHSDDPDRGSVGELIPGGEASTTLIPAATGCCGLAKVRLPANGVTLRAGTRYWLVASADNVDGSTFHGVWRLSNRAAYAGLVPPFPWDPQPGQWPAAEIRGTTLKSLASKVDKPEVSFEGATAGSKVTIFRNFAKNSLGFYDSNNGIAVTGQSVPFRPQIWLALPFTAKTDLHATTLAAAIGYISGTKKVNLGIYSDNDGIVGSVLPDGQVSTTDIPTDGQCCELTTVTLPGAGVALTAGTQYWLVASPDNLNAPDFSGLWHFSNLAVSAYEQPEQFINWTSFDGDWLAAEITGTNP